jgi:hypothetical protein
MRVTELIVRHAAAHHAVHVQPGPARR